MTPEEEAKSLPMKTKCLNLRMTEEQYRAVEQRANRRGVQVSYWMRHILLQVTQAPLNKQFVRVQEPSGETA